MKRYFLAAACLLAMSGGALAQDHPKGPYTLFVVVAGANGASIAISAADVFENSLRVQIRRDLIIPVASLPGLIVLKLFAWLDRHEGRDVQDIRRLIETYTDAGNVNRLYEEEADELERSINRPDFQLLLSSMSALAI